MRQLENTFLVMKLTNLSFLYSLAKNNEKGVEGGISPDTYLAFVIIESLA